MKVKTVYHPTCDDYVACLQRGGSPYYSGSMMQRGYGIGGLFKGLASVLLPLLPKVGKSVGKMAMKTAMGVVGDKMAGVPISKSIKQRTSAAGKKMVLNALSNGTGGKRRPPKRNKRRRVQSGKRIRRTDAFGTV